MRRKKNIKVDFSSTEKFQQTRQCPTCSNNLLQFWAPMTTDQEKKMVYGVGLFMGGILSTIIIPIVYFSLLGMIIGVVALLVGLAIAAPTFKEINTISQPPTDATEIPPSEELENQMKYIMNFALRMGLIGILVLIVALIL